MKHRSIRHLSRRQTRKSCHTLYGRGYLSLSFPALFHRLTPQPDKLEYPSDIGISQQAKDLIGGLLVKPAFRLGSGPTGVDELRHHPFFSVHSILSVMNASSFIPYWLTQTIDWDNLRHYPPPVVPDPLDLDSKPTNHVSDSIFVAIRSFIIDRM